MVNTAKIFLSNNFQCLFHFAVFTTCKQLVDHLINNAYHIRRRFIWLLTNIQTTSLQLINHIEHLSNLLTTCKQSHQPINNINHLANNINKNNIFANNIIQLAKIHIDNLQTANKQLTESFIINSSSTIWSTS